jgi:glycosyltransferase involved in cell wall biosynthesis
MPKLFQINATANWGSTGRIAEQIGILAQEHGWESFLAYGRKQNPSNNTLIRVGYKCSPYFHFAEQFIFDNEGLCSRLETKKLIRQIEQIKPDIINLHNIHDHFLNYKLLFEYLNKSDIKVVWTFHDCWAMTGHCMHFVNKGCDRWKTGCYDCLMRGEYPISLLDRSRRNWGLKKRLFAQNKNLTIVACSHWMADIVKESYLKDKTLEVIHNGCDIEIFTPQLREHNDKFRILAVSSIWNSNKGELDIYKLRRMLPEDEYDIVMVGLSSNQIKSLPSGIIGIQRTQNLQDLSRYYSDADVLINLSYEDTFPTVNIEALACGTPVITYRTGGSLEAVDLATGAIVEQADLNTLCERIKEFKFLKFKERHSTDCRKRAEELFDKHKCFERYIKLYERILK